MSTHLIDADDHGFYLTAFWGGSERGRCYQITQTNGIYVTLTAEQVHELAVAYFEHEEKVAGVR